MAAETYQRVWELFDAGIDLDVEGRRALLDRECGGDVDLRRQVEALWAKDSEHTAIASQLNRQDIADRLDDELCGAQLGDYHVLERIGAGGMGSVYLAKDVQLDRLAALKFPSLHLVGDQDFRKRFLREAKAAAALEHPNICTVYGLGTHRGRPFISMAFLKGRTVEDRIKSGALPVQTALAIAAQAGAGLAAAHAKGIVHRDVKPGNLILIEGAGRDPLVKVMDFGVSLVPDDTRLTAAGVPLGTAAYMSPEQTAGALVDHRSDIWSLGVVLYEMLTGAPPFGGDNTAEVFQAIRSSEPEPVSSKRPEAPPALDWVLAKALQKSPPRRYQEVDEFVSDIQQLRERPAAGRIHALRIHPDRLWLSAGFLLVAVAALALWAMWASETRKGEPMSPRPVTSALSIEWGPSLSPDARLIAYSVAASTDEFDSTDLYVQQLGGGPPLRLAWSPQAEFSPAWSPDGSEIAFLRQRAGEYHDLLVVSSLGGVERRLGQVRAPEPRQLFRMPPHMDYAPDGLRMVVVDRPEGERPFFIASLDLETGEKTQLTSPPDSSVGDLYPRLSPDGEKLAFVRYRNNSICTVYVHDLGSDGMPTGEPRRFRVASSPYNSSPAWTPDGRHILFAAGSGKTPTLWVVRDAEGAQPRRLSLTDVGVGMVDVQAAEDGQSWVLSYVLGENRTDIVRVPLERQDGWPVGRGEAEPLFPSSFTDTEPNVSPDGKQIAFASPRSGSEQLWIGRADGSGLHQVTNFRSVGLHHPRWSPDGRHILVAVDENQTSNIYSVSPEQMAVEPVISSPHIDDRPEWSNDGRFVYFRSDRDGPGWIWKAPVGGGEPRVAAKTTLAMAAEAPDGADLLAAFQGVWRIPPDGPPSRLGDADSYRIEVHAGGVFSNGPDHVFRYYDFARSQSQPVYSLERGGVNFSVSPDGRFLYAEKPQTRRVDIMVVENLKESLP